MRSRGAVAVALMMALLPMMAFVSAEETGEETAPIPITPADSATKYAVFFADNMAFGPQWRVGNLVRIEVMVLRLIDINLDGALTAADLPEDYVNNFYVNSTVDRDPLEPLCYTQTDLMADPSLILRTFMVSVPEMWVTISGEGLTFTFHSQFLEDGTSVTDPSAVGAVGREINKGGHLIYGFKWDTSVGDVVPGDYRVTVSIPSVYPVSIAVEHLYPVTDETVTDDETVEVDPIGYVELPAYVDGSNDPSGTGAVIAESNAAFIYLGELISKGGSGSSSDGGGNGNGNVYLGGSKSKGQVIGKVDR